MILVAGWEANIGGLGVGVAAVGACVAAVSPAYTADASVAAVDAWRSHRLRACTTSELASDLHHI
jgi:hypothetical protein